MINSTRKILICFAVFLIAFMAYAPVLNRAGVYALNAEVSFDSTNALEDLQSSTINGKPFDLTEYPRNPYGKVSVITFAEYCYSQYDNGMSNYSLYIYVYNPALLNLSESIGSNKIQLATAFNEDNTPADYSKFQLKYCNKSEGDYYKLFYKFKVLDTSGKILSAIESYAKANNGLRRYHISGIELLTVGDYNATDYSVATTYEYMGFADGYGSSDFPLSYTSYSFETVSLDVKHTFYRTATSTKGAGYQNQLDTVYFAVPKRFFETYGKLQRIKAEWCEYKTKDIVVTSNSDFYTKALPYLGVQTGAIDKWGMPEYNKDIYYSLGQNAGDWGGGLNAATWGYNLGSGYLHPACAMLSYLFKVDNISGYDPYADIVSIGGVESNALYQYILNYDKSFSNGTLPIKSKAISADLFESDIDDYRKLDTQYGKIQQGYSYYDFDADVDLQKLSSWQESDPSFWDNWINFGLWKAMTGNIPAEQGRTVPPIITLKESDLNGTASEVSERLLVNFTDVDRLKDFYTTAESEEKVVVLFRFATTDYYSAPVDIIELGKGFLWSDKHTSGQAYRAWESVFFDFDIIQLTFNKDGINTVIPAVSSPIDIINGITTPVVAPNNGLPWWVWLIVAIVSLIVLIILSILIKPIAFIIKVVFKVSLLPFKLFWKLLKTISKRGDKSG